MAKESDPATEMRVCAVPGIYPCAGCDNREDPTFGTEIEPGNGICIGSDCADVSLWADAADANEATHKVIVPGAGNNALSADEIRAFLLNPVPEGAQDGCAVGAVPLEPEKTEEEKAAEAAELARLTEQLVQQAAAQRQRATQQSEDTLLRAIQNDEAWLDNRTGDYYLSQEDAVEGALKAIGRSLPGLTSYEAVQMVSILGPGGRQIGTAVSAVPQQRPEQPPRQEPTRTGSGVKVKTKKKKTKTRETEFEVVDPEGDEVIAVYKTRRGAENRAAKNASFGHYVREVPIRERERTPQSRKAIRTTEFEVVDPEGDEVIAVYKTRRGAEIRAARNTGLGHYVREIPARSVTHKTKTRSRRRKTKTKSRRRKTKTKSRRRKTKTKSRRRKTKTKSRRRKAKTRSRRRVIT